MFCMHLEMWPKYLYVLGIGNTFVIKTCLNTYMYMCVYYKIYKESDKYLKSFKNLLILSYIFINYFDSLSYALYIIS